MAPSADSVEMSTTGIPQNGLANGLKHGSDVQKAAASSKGSKGAENPPELSKNEKLSGAALKALKKAEKAAKRGQAKQEQELPSQDSSKTNRPDVAKDKATKDSMPQHSLNSSSKGQHKRTNSSGNPQKALPLRPNQQQGLAATHITPEPKKESKNVKLFGHLYGAPKKSTIAGANKDVHHAILALGQQMSNYAICGSNARCVSTLLAFKEVINSYSTPLGTSLPRHLTTHLSSQIDYLVSCRPLSISMGNAIRWLKLKISHIDPDYPEAKARSDLCSAIDNFIRERITVADQVIADSAGSKIQDGDVVLTYAKSSTVESTLVKAHRQQKKIKVIVVDSRPLYEGRTFAKTLADRGIEVQYALTHSLSHVIKDATKVFLGAHAMMSNGHLYSRVGTAMVALMAKDLDIPVIVCCESIKFTDRVALDSIVTNEIAPPDELLILSDKTSALSKWSDTPNLQFLNLMYDLTPAEYIHMIITEYGSLPPSSVPVVHRLSTDT